jgi:hypothetical protein
MRTELKKWTISFLWIPLFFIASCTQHAGTKDDPKGRLTEYISRSFSVKGMDDRQELVAFLTGDAKARLLAWSEDQFRAAFIDSKRQFVKLAISEVKSISQTETSITYELTYIDQAKGKDAKVTQKKLCQMNNESGKWFISDVKNIKELIEYRNEMALP